LAEVVVSKGYGEQRTKCGVLGTERGCKNAKHKFFDFFEIDVLEKENH